MVWYTYTRRNTHTIRELAALVSDFGYGLGEGQAQGDFWYKSCTLDLGIETCSLVVEPMQSLQGHDEL